MRGEPIVCSPDDAFKCFMNTEMDLLAIGDYLLLKDEQEQECRDNYDNIYQLD